MPIPDSEHAVVDPEKVGDYLLSLEHPDGGSKAAWFHALGYHSEAWQLLADDLLAIARDCEKYDAKTTPFGIKYKASGTIGGPYNRSGCVLTTWIVEDDNPPRLVTAYPDEAP